VQKMLQKSPSNFRSSENPTNHETRTYDFPTTLTKTEAANT